MELETLALRAGLQARQRQNAYHAHLPIHHLRIHLCRPHGAPVRSADRGAHLFPASPTPPWALSRKKIAAMEGGVGALMTTSGQAASLLSVLNICKAGDHILCTAGVYGGTVNLFGVTLKRFGIDCTFVSPDATMEELNAAVRENTRLVFSETLTNPTLVVCDIEKFAGFAHSHGIPLIVDNTFATPMLCRPFDFGADIVTHSTTKYMDGHAVVVGRRDRRRQASSTGPAASSRSSPSPTPRTTARSTRTTARRPTSSSAGCSSCATSACCPARRTRSCWTWACRPCRCA